MDLLKQVGLNIRKLRLARDMSQESVALEADIAMNYLSGIERGTRNASLRVIGRLAAVLGAQVIEFLAPVSPRDVLGPTLRPGRRPRNVVRQKKPSVPRRPPR